MKTLKSFTALFSIILLLAALSACNSNNEENTSSSTTEKSNPIEIKDIAWNVDEGILEGERYILLDYTNNSKHTITGFELTFKEKPDITDEEKEKFYSEVKKKFEFNDEEIAELKEESISMHVETDKVVNPEETVKNIFCYYYSGYGRVKDANHFNLVEPDIATIKYIDDNKIHTTYYDFASEKYSAEEETVVAYQWSRTDLGNKIPKPDMKVVESEIDDTSTFMFDAYGMSSEQFDAYVEQCIDLGYTVDQKSYEGSYSANNAEGYNVDLYYYEEDDQMSATIKVPEK